VEIHAPTDVTGDLYAVTRSVDGYFDAEVLDERGRVVVALRGYRTIALPSGAPRGEEKA
jgi:hypothetical protein